MKFAQTSEAFGGLGFCQSTYLIFPEKLSKIIKVILQSLEIQKVKFEEKLQQLKNENQQLKQLKECPECATKQLTIQKLTNQIGDIKKIYQDSLKIFIKKDDHILSLEREVQQLTYFYQNQMQIMLSKINKYNKRNQNLTLQLLKLRDKINGKQKHVKNKSQIYQHNYPPKTSTKQNITTKFQPLKNLENYSQIMVSKVKSISTQPIKQKQSISTPRFVRKRFIL